MSTPRCIPTRRDPLFGGWLVSDTVTHILLNAHGPVTKQNLEEFHNRHDAEVSAAEWNALFGRRRALCPKYVRYLAAQKVVAIA